VAAICATAALAAAAPAWAEQRFVAPPPTGQASGTCTAAEPPCTLERAVETVAGTGDEVIVSAGDYTETDPLDITDANLRLHGGSGARPVIHSTGATEAVDAQASGVRVADLAIDYTGTSTGLRLRDNTLGERLEVKSAGTVACNIIGATLRDSVCWDTGANGNAIFNSNTTNVTVTTTVRNVTAVATGADSDGIEIVAGSGLDHVLDAKNVIASGIAFDAQATQDVTSTATINLANSNYDSENPAQTGTVTDPGTGTNQTQQPAFVNAATGDFHQQASSPTIDAGATDPLLGSGDLDNQPRNQGAAPDIGADEFVPPGPEPAANGDNFPPDTKILKGPRKRTEKRKAKFQFGGSEPGLTFECSLDDKEFKPCMSPEKFRSLKRTKHEFAVRAVDAAGNRDPTPADRNWSIKKKKKRK
jgi:hypothetical protein